MAEGPGPLHAEREGALSAAGSFAHELMSRARTQLFALRSQVRRLNLALMRSEAARVSLERGPAGARAPLPLAQPLRGGIVPAEKAEQLVSVWLAEDHLHALVEAGLLARGDIGDRVKVAQALRAAMDRWSQRVPAGRHADGKQAAQGDRQAQALPGRPGNGDDRIIRLEAARAARTAARLATAAGGAPPRRPHGGPLCGVAPMPPQGWTGAHVSRLAVPAQDAQRIDRQRQPDEGERGEVNRREGLVVDEHREQEVTGRRDVLQEPDRGEPDPLRPGDEQQQR